MRPLTEEQTRILRFVRRRIIHDLPLTVQEIADELGVHTRSLVATQLAELQRKGCIRRTGDTVRPLCTDDKPQLLGNLLKEILEPNEPQLALAATD